MILELAVLNVIAGKEQDFEVNFAKAQKIISQSQGYMSHELQRRIEVPSRYILLVKWQTIEDHEIGFRKSQEYQKWKALLHHFYDPFPKVEHYKLI
jgi:heme-degrading monooxygenase HmoA